MSRFNGNIWSLIPAIAFLLLLSLPHKAECQTSILDSTYTFSAGTVKTGDALAIISRQTGYSFTYDSRLVDASRDREMTFTNLSLRSILKNILFSDSLQYSIIDKYIIISRADRFTLKQADSLRGPEIRYITGNIYDSETRDMLPFATVALKNRGRGTVSNKNGEFGLKINPGISPDTLSFSYLGYVRNEISLKSIKGNTISVPMLREYVSIPEIIIRNQIPQDIVNKARNMVTRNYGTTPAYMTGFYREGVIKKNQLQTYSEAILRIYKSAYSGTLYSDQIKVYKSRKIENTGLSDTLTVRLKAGLSSSLELDGAKNIFDFMSPETMPEYRYRMTDIVSFDNEEAYAIDFEQRDDVDLPLFKGTLYINTSDYGILDAEFELNKSFISKLKDSFVTGAVHGFNTWPVSVKYSISYRKQNNRYFLSHVRGDLVFTSDRKKIFFSTQFRVFFELAITETELENVSRFDRDELAPVHSIFSKTINSYDPLFWGNQDFLKPEDNLLKALKNINVKLQEFSK